jgi:hypothetical protein
MADRNLATNNGGLTRPGANPRGSATLAGVRRNFFQGQQPSRARRPGPVTADSAETAETVRLDADVPNANTSDIVVRDQDGEIKWGDPPSPDLDESMELPDESRQEVERMLLPVDMYCLYIQLTSFILIEWQRSGKDWQRQSSLIREAAMLYPISPKVRDIHSMK